MEIKNKTVLITGGTSGIGLEIVKTLAPHNHIIVLSRKNKLSDKVLNEAKSIELHHVDISNKSALEDAIHEIHKRHDQLDILINNAAVQHTPEFLSDDFNYDGIETEISTNFTSICHLSYLCLPMLLAAENSKIINVNSGLAIAPKQASAIYCATKSALNSFSTSLRYQLRDKGIAVHQVFLPLVDTAMTAGRGKGKLSADKVAEAVVASIIRKSHYTDVGKVKLLRFINYLLPPLAARIMRAG